MIRYYLAGVLVALASSVGQICFKFVSRRTGAGSSHGPVRRALAIALDPWFSSGAALFVASAAASVWIMTAMDFSVYYSLSAFNYVFITVLSRLMLREPIGGRKVLGNVIIVAGIVIYSL